MKKVFTKRFGNQRLSVQLDSKQIIPDNPGDGTPAMVVLYDSRNKEIDAGTYNCVSQLGVLSSEGTELSPAQMEWLNSLYSEVDTFLTRHGG